MYQMLIFHHGIRYMKMGVWRSFVRSSLVLFCFFDILFISELVKTVVQIRVWDSSGQFKTPFEFWCMALFQLRFVLTFMPIKFKHQRKTVQDGLGWRAQGGEEGWGVGRHCPHQSGKVFSRGFVLHSAGEVFDHCYRWTPNFQHHTAIIYHHNLVLRANCRSNLWLYCIPPNAPFDV